MIFLIAIFVPPIALVARDAKYDAIASLIMLCVGILLMPALVPYLWIAAVVHSFAVIRRQDEDRRTQEIIGAICGRSAAPEAASTSAAGTQSAGQLSLQSGV